MKENSIIHAFAELEKRISLTKPVQLCVAGAADKDLLLAVKVAQEKGYLEAILVGDAKEITPIAEEIAFLAAGEVVNKNIPATTDALELANAAARGEIGPCIAEGPVALDVIFDPLAAQHKGIESVISGDVDLLLYPNIETGNALCKSWIYFSQAKWGGLVLGCSCPLILGSRSDTADVKINSILLGCLGAQS